MNLRWFANIVVHHPFAIIFAVIVFSLTCLTIPFATKNKTFPSFSDPQLGFSTRGTVIANRLTTWDNLVESTRPSGQFAVNPKELLYLQNLNSTFLYKKRRKSHKKKKSKQDYGNILISERHNVTNNNYENWKVIRKMANQSYVFKAKVRKDKEGFFCGYPDEKYAHIVIKTRNANLLDLSSLMNLCLLEYKLLNAQNFSELCVQNTKTSKCCKPWSLGNYIALLHDRNSCLGLNEEDVNSTISLLNRCAKYYFNMKLLPDCSERIFHCEAPKECVKYDAVYNILNFLTTTNFISKDGTSEILRLEETMIFLPIAGSTAILPYFHAVENLKLDNENLEVVAMDFGIKSTLFDEYLVHDMWLMATGTLFILLSMWLYTKSFFLTIATIIGIIFSLGIAYFFYVLIFELKFFPFMNLLAIIVAIGIGSDDAFIFCKIWLKIKQEDKDRPLVHVLTDTFHHAFVSIFVTTITTTVAFMASYISSVTAVCCFSIFAGTAVIANFLLMVTWFPACVIVWEKYCCSTSVISQNFIVACLCRGCCMNRFAPTLSMLRWPKWNTIDNLWHSKEKYLLNCVIRLRYMWILMLSSIAIGSIILVMYYPKLELPDSQDFQLFASSHPFEQYDFVYKDRFWFHRESFNAESNYELPLRFVWGVYPIDNGNYLDPTDLGNLELDPDFNMSDPSSQQWLLKFCKNIKREPFFRAMMGPLLPNCFIETFLKSMQRTCHDFMSGEDRSPCCKSSKFPFSPEIFDKCIIQEMADIYETPSQFLIPGVAGPKFSKDQNPTIKVVVVEYVSNYSYSMSYEVMNDFYNQVENWMNEQLKTAPKGMRSGWFVSELKFYDLQRELATSTIYSILLSMGLALAVLIFSTLNLLLSFFAILTITCSIFVTIAILVLLGWKLNILESVAISTAIGLTVDFSLHYSVNYRLCPIGLVSNRKAATTFALSNMAGPALMAAITTGAAGACMLPSRILPYIQIGIFLVIVMSVSWLYSTFFLGSLLATIGPQNHFGQFSYSYLYRRFRNGPITRARGQPTTSSVSDTHELETLTDKSIKTISKSVQKSYKAGTNINRVLSDQSPSATSAITIIMADDN